MSVSNSIMSQWILAFLKFRAEGGGTLYEIESEIVRKAGVCWRWPLVRLLRELSDQGLLQRRVEEPQGDRAERYLYVYNIKPEDT